MAMKLDDTQELRHEDMDKTVIMRTKTHGVRELPPAKGNHPSSQPINTSNAKSRKRKRLMILAGVFAAALIVGFGVTGYVHDKEQLAENDALHSKYELQRRESEIGKRESELSAKKKELEQKKAELEAKRKRLAEQRGSLQNDADGIRQETDGRSALEKIRDKITGRDKKLSDAASSNKAAQAKNGSESGELDAALSDAQEMLDNVNKKIGEAQQLKQQASETRAAAEKAYHENEGTINRLFRYVGDGAKSFTDMFR